ncbi:MAG: hypothetical protein HRJ53_11730, partial [Acidobacteria bacterium Pan2503]|nr:hypothetical protein [Candidatus Acidoferrum panamensis]
YVTEYATISNVPTAVGQMPLEPPIADYTVSIPGVSPSFQAATRMVKLSTDTTCSILFGPPGTNATTTNSRMPAGAYDYHGVPEGRGFVVSVVGNS